MKRRKIAGIGTLLILCILLGCIGLMGFRLPSDLYCCCGGETITPGDLNRLFSETRVYDGEGNLQWGSLEELEGYSVQVYGRAAEQDMINCL